MVDTVHSRLNHYEVLGLKPTAGEDEVRQAFARAMSMFRPAAEVARLGIAYETLRDADRRRAYDASIGIGAKPKPPQYPTSVSFKISTGFIGSATSERPEPRAVEPPPAPAPVVQPPAAAEEPIETKLAALIASLREIAEPVASAPVPQPDPDPQPQPQPQPRPDPKPALRPELPVQQFPKVHLTLEESPRGAEAPDWMKPVLAVGGFIVAAGLIGTMAGMSVTGNEVAAQGDPAVTAPLPAAKPRAESVAPAPASGSLEEGRFEPSLPAAAAQPPVSRSHSATRPTVANENRIAEIQSAIGSAQEAAPELAAADTPAAPAVAASLPLPNNVIARTIERIGYSCGDVVSATAVEGGAYKVACSSGQSYQARPVRGRYHFRRWSRN